MKKGFDKNIFMLAKAIKKNQEKARALGMFVDDRELLKCINCGLMEDITIDSMLITYIEKDLDSQTARKDSGHRFKPTKDENIFLCPVCKNSVYLPEIKGWDE